jgi:hypothetical protein
MTVTILTDTWTDRTTREITWSTSLSDPLFYIYRDGALVTTTYAETWSFGIPENEDPVISVRDDATPPGYYWPGRIYLSWYPDAAVPASYYLIEEDSGAGFVEVARIPQTGLGYYRWLTQWLSDGYDTVWRITPVDAAGNSGEPLDFEYTQVRHPDTPNVEFSYSEITGIVTITDGN